MVSILYISLKFPVFLETHLLGPADLGMNLRQLPAQRIFFTSFSRRELLSKTGNPTLHTGGTGVNQAARVV